MQCVSTTHLCIQGKYNFIRYNFYLLTFLYLFSCAHNCVCTWSLHMPNANACDPSACPMPMHTIPPHTQCQCTPTPMHANTNVHQHQHQCTPSLCTHVNMPTHHPSARASTHTCPTCPHTIPLHARMHTNASAHNVSIIL